MSQIQQLVTKLGKITLCLFVVFLFFRCGGDKDYVPKPIGYNRIEKPHYIYNYYQQPRYSFEYADIAKINEEKDSLNWFNIVYPNYKAIVYCSYLPINKQTLNKALEDSYHLAYSHTIMAEAINGNTYSDDARHIGGMLYQLDGNVATPIQFFVTDSTSHFLRGSLYYTEHFNLDSVAPITDFIKDDIIHIFETVKFSDNK